MNEKSMGMPAPAEHVVGEDKETITLEQMKSLANHPYVRLGDEKSKDDRSWGMPEEPLEAFSAEHYKRVQELVEYWREQERATVKLREKNAKQVIELIVNNIKSDNVIDLIHEMSGMYLDFSIADSNIRQAARQAGERAMQWQGKKEHESKAEEDTFRGETESFLKSRYQDQNLNLDLFLDPAFVLSRLCDYGRTKYPEYDWKKINDSIYFGDHLSNKAEDYLLEN